MEERQLKIWNIILKRSINYMAIELFVSGDRLSVQA